MVKSGKYFALLTSREKLAVRKLNRIYRKRYHKPPDSNPELFYYLGDNPDNRITWSATSNRLPTFRVGRGLRWHVPSSRFLTGREKLSTLGFPLDACTAASMGVPELPVRCTKRASCLAGNAMHWQLSMSMIILLLTCVFGETNKRISLA